MSSSRNTVFALAGIRFGIFVVVSLLVTANPDGEKLSDRELGSFFSLLLVAGNETARNTMAHGIKMRRNGNARSRESSFVCHETSSSASLPPPVDMVH